MKKLIAIVLVLLITGCAGRDYDANPCMTLDCFKRQEISECLARLRTVKPDNPWVTIVWPSKSVRDLALCRARAR